MKRLTTLIGVFLASSAAVPAWAQQGYGYGRMGGWGWHSGFFFGPLITFLIIIAIVFLIARIAGWTHHSHGFHRHCGHRRGALDILEERFARGEIDKNEFEEKRKLLER